MKHWWIGVLGGLAMLGTAADIGNRNVVFNGSFELATNPAGLPDGWGNGQWGIKFADEISDLARVRAGFGADAQVRALGERSFRLQNAAGTRMQALYSSWIKFPAFTAAPDGWVLSAYLKTDAAPVAVKLEIVDAGNVALFSEEFTVTSEFQRYAARIPKLKESPIAIRIASAPGTVWIDGVQLEKGREPSEWSAAKFDTMRTETVPPPRAFVSTIAAEDRGATAIQAVTVSDRVLRVDDEAFFPCAANLGWTSDPEALRAVKAAGFNTVVIDSCDLAQTQTALDDAAAVGLAVIPWLTCDTPTAIEIVEALHTHPALLFWQATDEPVDPLAAAVSERVERLRQLDRFHPVMVNYLSGSIAEQGGELARLPGDIISSDVYPIANTQWPGTLLDTANILIGMEEALRATPKIPMFYLQITGNAFMNYREPTPEEFEAMVYASVIGGARGLFFFQNIPWNPRLFDVAGQIGRELHELAPVLASTAPVPAIGCSSAAIRWTARYDQGELYLICVNTAAEPVQVRFQVPGTVAVCFEDRVIAGENGQFSDEFAGYQRHVYRITP